MSYTSGTNWTYEMVKEHLFNLGYVLIDLTYKSIKTKLTFKDEEGYYYFCPLVKIKKKSHEKFHKSNPYTIQNIKLWCKLNDKPMELLSSTYEGNQVKLKWKCLKEECFEEYWTSWCDIHDGQGCPFCHGFKVGLSNCLATKNPKLASEWHSTKNGVLTPFDITCGSKKNIWWQCSKNPKHIWKSNLVQRHNGIGCPKCSKSKGENKISELLDLKNINYIIQKKFNNLKGVGKRYLSYDFYLPTYNLLIEYQGEQHEHYIEGLQKSKEKFEIQIEHDKRKREYAELNNYNLLEIWYYDFNNIEKILNTYVYFIPILPHNGNTSTPIIS